jgi:MSHA biogenesis protein MshG
MQRFSYTARDRSGTAQQGSGDATTASAMAAQLVARGLTPVTIRANDGNRDDRGDGGPRGGAAAAAAAPAASLDLVKTLAAWRSALTAARGPERPDPRDMTMSLRELAALLKAGIPIMRALRLVAETSDSPALRDCYEHLIADLDSGRDLAGAMEREMQRSGAFERYDVAMVSVGERTGRLDRALHDLYDHRAFMRQTAEQVGSALRYPMFVIATCLIALVVINLFVIPSFAKVFANLNTELPLLTRVLLGSSKLMVTWWPLIAAAGVLVALALRRWTQTTEGRLIWDRWLLRAPLIGPVLFRIVLSRFTSSLAGSLASGLTITVALQATAQTLGNAHMAAALDRLQNSVERGESLSRAAVATGAFPPALLQIMAIGEESGTLDELLQEMSVHYHSEVEYAVKRLSSNLEPILIGAFGIGVLVMALGVFMPMWELGHASTK